MQEGDDSLAIDCDGKQTEETLSPTPSPTTVEIVFKSVYMGTPEPEETIAQFEEETYTIAQYVTPTPVIITEFVEATPPNFTRATPTPEPALMAGYCMMCGSYFEIHRYDWSKYYGNAYCKDCSEAIQYREVPSPDEVNYGGGFYKKGNCLHCGAYFEITGGSNCWSSWAYSYCKRCTQDIRSGKIPQPSADMFPDKTDMPTPAPTPTPTPTPAPTLKTPPRRIGPVATPKPEREYQ